MGKENRLYSISLGVASLQGGLVGVATGLSRATCRPSQVFSPSFFCRIRVNSTCLFIITCSIERHRNRLLVFSISSILGVVVVFTSSSFLICSGLLFVLSPLKIERMFSTLHSILRLAMK